MFAAESSAMIKSEFSILISNGIDNGQHTVKKEKKIKNKNSLNLELFSSKWLVASQNDRDRFALIFESRSSFLEVWFPKT